MEEYVALRIHLGELDYSFELDEWNFATLLWSEYREPKAPPTEN